MGALFSVFSSQFLRPTPAYRLLKQSLDGKTPEHSYVFPGSPIAELQHPLLQQPMQHQPHYLHDSLMDDLAVAWNAFGTFCDSHILPEFERGKDVVLDGCGMDVLFAFTMKARSDMRDRLSQAHHDFVQKVLTTRGIKPPTYLIVSASPAHEYDAFVEQDPHTPVTQSEYRDYLSVLDDFVQQYLAHPAQRTPIRVSCDRLNDTVIGEDLFARLTQWQESNDLRVAA